MHVVPTVAAALLLALPELPLLELERRFLPRSVAMFWLGWLTAAAGLGIVAVALLGLAQWRKLRIEERGMRQLCGERYLAYKRRVPALIPFAL